jgi:hypothetical protein
MFAERAPPNGVTTQRLDRLVVGTVVGGASARTDAFRIAFRITASVRCRAPKRWREERLRMLAR